MNTVMLTTLARPPPARFSTVSICENTCFTCASKLLAMSLPSLSRVAVCPATQTILPPSVMTPGENARESWNGVFSMYSAAATGSETRANRNPARMRFMISPWNGLRRKTLAQAAREDKPSAGGARPSRTSAFPADHEAVRGQLLLDRGDAVLLLGALARGADGAGDELALGVELR